MEGHLKHLLLNNDFRKVELEFRIGEMDGTRFVSSIRKVVWNQMKNNMKDKVKEVPEEQTIVDKYVGYGNEGISTRFVAKSNGEEFWEQKKKVDNTTVPNGKFAMRTSLALEEKSTSPPPGTPIITSNSQFTTQRKKMRASYMLGPWRVDFTRVEQIPDNSDTEETYEVEVELADAGIFFEKEIEQVLHEGKKIVDMLVSDITY
ncbi:mRNA capping enzyme beta chain [Acanthocystis turfacea Chlorella virus Br0604L]|nr:mRNA capping enzyme beta chain [Acanthocystis turfacea Chlorella virus Br0604L]